MSRPATSVLFLVASLFAADCASHPRLRTVVPLEPSAIGAVETYGPGLVATDDSGETVTFALEASAGVVAVRVWPGWRLEPLYPTRNRDTTYFQTGTHVVRVPRPSPWDTLAAARQPPPPRGSQAAREQEAERCLFDAMRRRRPPPPARAPTDTSARKAPPAPQPLDMTDIGAIEDQCRRAVGLGESPPARRDSVVERGKDYYIVLVASDVTLDAKHLRQKLAGIDITGTEPVAVLQALPGFLAGAKARTWAGYTARVGAP